ncbi:MAG TPA: hypothetical protein GXZ67_05790 [Clostridiaceae bacterium]|jgi:hypothetical protein|nr:hypothetical protein [Clostridiaceae bacterium]
MTDIDIQSINNSEPTGNTFITGDIFEGLIVSEYVDNKYEISTDDASVIVTQKVISQAPDRICLGFLFQCTQPARFRLDVLIPENCYNAIVSLNDHELVGYFSKDLPENPEYVIKPSCDGKDKVSTLKPGEFQSINFRWETGDVLKFFFYFK